MKLSSKYLTVMFIGIQSQLVSQIQCLSLSWRNFNVVDPCEHQKMYQIRYPRRNLAKTPCFEASQRPIDTTSRSSEQFKVPVDSREMKTIGSAETRTHSSDWSIRAISQVEQEFLRPKFCISSSKAWPWTLEMTIDSYRVTQNATGELPNSCRES